MKSAVSKIDRALKRLYNLDSPLRAQDFLMAAPPDTVKKTQPPGALYIKPPTESDPSLSMGIYLNSEVGQSLERLPWRAQWQTEQIAAFGLATEEVSHFHYIAYHAPHGRGVSQIELEFQGEVDKFLLCYFVAVSMQQAEAQPTFEALVETLFVQVSWLPYLSIEKKQRYEEASQLARSFVCKHVELVTAKDPERFLKLLRAFYRSSMQDKVRTSTP